MIHHKESVSLHICHKKTVLLFGLHGMSPTRQSDKSNTTGKVLVCSGIAVNCYLAHAISSSNGTNYLFVFIFILHKMKFSALAQNHQSKAEQREMVSCRIVNGAEV